MQFCRHVQFAYPTSRIKLLYQTPTDLFRFQQIEMRVVLYQPMPNLIPQKSRNRLESECSLRALSEKMRKFTRQAYSTLLSMLCKLDYLQNSYNFLWSIADDQSASSPEDAYVSFCSTSTFARSSTSRTMIPSRLLQGQPWNQSRVCIYPYLFLEK